MVTIEEVSEVEVASSSSSSAGDHQRSKYDVFLSFRGKDIRKTFIDHLYSALERSGIYTFKDNERLETGESTPPALLKAIEQSSFAVVVFSKNYASSRWCLDELVKIMECSGKSPKEQTIIPIFYDVEPSDVRKQEGYFGEMFRKHDSDRVQIWRKALTDAANLSGLELNKIADGHESKFIDRIVQEIWSKLPSKIEVEDEGLVGMNSRIKKVTLLLGEESNVVRTVGIWGLSGIGKSTLARAVYGQIKDQFQVAHFLDEVGEVSKKNSLRSLQQHLLSKTLGVKDLQIANDMDGIALMKTRLRSRRVLLVLDDIDSLEQLEALAGSHEWFGPGSRIIITTRDRKLLVTHNVVRIHKVSLLDYVEATKLFRWKAFNDVCPAEDFKKLSVQVIKYSGRLPLAIKVLGSALYGEDLNFWKTLLEKLRKVGPDGKILEKLKIGFDGLEESVQNTFLDIACFLEARRKKHFLPGWQKYVTRILKSFDFYPDHSIPILIHKSLIHSSNGRVCMHHLIGEMGRHIVRQNFPREPGKYSRLWNTSDIEHVLTSNTGTEYIEGIMLYPHGREYTIEMGTEAFRQMSNLRLLEIHNTCIPKGPDYLPNELRWIDWDKYPSNYLPKTFEAQNLVGLRLRCSRLKQLWEGRMSRWIDWDEYPSKYPPTTFEADFLIGLRLHCSRLKQLWEGRTKKKLKNLKYVDFSYSRNLVGISHLEEACNLEELILQGCTSLVKVDLSIGFFKKLVCLNFSGCKNLVILPSTFYTLKRLKSLILSGCSKFKNLQEEIGNLERLEELLLDESAVTELPLSIRRLKNLKNLSFGNSSSQSPISIFQSLFQLRISQKTTRSLVLPPIWGLTSLTRLDLIDCNLLAIPSDLGSLFSLKVLLLGGNNFENLPSLNQLSKLEKLLLSRCEILRELPELPSRLKKLVVNNCASLRVSVDRLAMCKLDYGCFQNCRKLLDYGESEIVACTLLQQKLKRPRVSLFLPCIVSLIILPGRVIPEWFCNHTFTGDSVLLKLPKNWYLDKNGYYNPKFKGYSFFIIFEAINKVKYLSWLGGLRHDNHITCDGVQLWFREPRHKHPTYRKIIYLPENISGMENTIMSYQTSFSYKRCRKCHLKNKRAGIEVGIRSVIPNTLVVKKWGIRLVFNDDNDDDDDSCKVM